MQRLISRRWPELLLAAIVCVAATVPAGRAATAPPTLPPPSQPSEKERAATETQPAGPRAAQPSGPGAEAARPLVSTIPVRVVPAGGGEVTAAARQEAPPAHPFEFWPRLDGAGLTWFAVVVILLLSFRLKPLLSEHNLDALVLAATSLLLALRFDNSRMPHWAAGQTGQWWSYLLLSVAAGYWALRGLYCLLAPSIGRHECTVSKSAMFILVLAGLAVAVARVGTDPLSPSSRDGIVGGLFMADSGKLPYGEAGGHDSQSPLLYLLHAGAVELIGPTTLAASDQQTEFITMTWKDRGQWLGHAWWEEGDFAAARLVNGLLFILFAVALSTLGRQLHSPAIGLTMVAIFCVFPGAAECLTQPDVMLPATLLAWSISLALVPGVGGLLSSLLIVLAGFAWPWAWLGLPVLLGYFLRNGWSAVGGIIGTLAGLAVGLAGLTWLTLPSLPRADGALERADMTPAYTVTRSAEGQLAIAPRPAGPAAQAGWLRAFWRFLVDSESLALDPGASAPGLSWVVLGDGVDVRGLLYHKLAPTDAAREEVARRYRLALEREPQVTRLWVALRTVLEQTWLTSAPLPAPLKSAWALWSAAHGEEQGWWPTVRKGAKVAAGLLAIAIGLVLLIGHRPRPHQLIGGLLMVCSLTLVASSLGAVTNLVWLLPTLLALWAVHEEPPAFTEPSDPEALPDLLRSGPAPRITVEH
jgi:hypothetical protein